MTTDDAAAPPAGPGSALGHRGARPATVTQARYVWDNGRAVVAARWYLRHADSVGSRVRLWGRPSIENHGRMVIGSRVQLVSTVATLELVDPQPRGLQRVRQCARGTQRC